MDNPPTLNTTPAQARSSRMLLLVLALSVYFVGSAEFMLSSMLSPLAQAFRTSPEGAAWLISSYACSYAVAAPVLGYFSDRVNRGRLLLVALLLFAVDAVGIVFSPSLKLQSDCGFLAAWPRLR
jgi:DHA1 family inner membrane transport protein